MGLRTCLDCGLSSEELSLFKKNGNALYGRANLCLECERKRGRAYIRKRRRVLDDIKRRPCDICGRTFPPCAMDFHHRDESAKLFGIADAIIFHNHSIEEIMIEVNKCMVVCACCHRILHFEQEESNGNET